MTSATVSGDFVRLPFRYCITVSTHALTIKQTCTDLFSSSCENAAVFDITNILFVNIFFSFAAKIVRSEAFAAKPLGESPFNSSLGSKVDLFVGKNHYTLFDIVKISGSPCGIRPSRFPSVTVVPNAFCRVKTVSAVNVPFVTANSVS